jgi:hypothetical protein
MGHIFNQKTRLPMRDKCQGMSFTRAAERSLGAGLQPHFTA